MKDTAIDIMFIATMLMAGLTIFIGRDWYEAKQKLEQAEAVVHAADNVIMTESVMNDPDSLEAEYINKRMEFGDNGLPTTDNGRWTK